MHSALNGPMFLFKMKPFWINQLNQQFSFLASHRIRLQLHGAIYRPDSSVLMLCYCAILKEIRYESKSLNRIVADKSHCVIAAERDFN